MRMAENSKASFTKRYGRSESLDLCQRMIKDFGPSTLTENTNQILLCL